MRTILKCFLFVVVLCTAAAFVYAQSGTPAKQSLRVLYVGNSAPPDAFPKNSTRAAQVDPKRMPDFKQFLEKNFVSVKTCEGKDFTPELARDVDVIIMDWDVPPGRIPPDFRKPMVVMGGQGFFAVQPTGTKIDWL